MRGQKLHGDMDSENSQAGKNCGEDNGLREKKNCLAASEKSGKRKMKVFNSAAEHGIALGGSGGLKGCEDIENCWVENNLAAGIISELYDLTRRKSRGWGDGLMFASTSPSRFEENCVTEHVQYPGTTVESKEQDIADSGHPKA
jgi:hypothetical protein